MSDETSRSGSAWFNTGFMVAVLVCAALNALSYFARSDGWGNLVGQDSSRREAIGFPVEMWEEGNNYGGWFVDYRSLLINAGVAVVLGVALGLATWTMRHRLNHMMAELEARYGDDPKRSFQFSMRGLLLSTMLVAFVATGLRHWLAARPEALGAIFALGPWLLVGLALLPRKIPWEQRVGLIIPLTFGLILVAVAIGGTLPAPRNLEQVLMGIFICWTPQAALAALGMTTLLLFIHRSMLLKPARGHA